jgi:hypothetical protein
MPQMLSHQTYIYRLARFLHEHAKTMSLGELVMHLNRNGVKSPVGEFSTENHVGIGKAISAVYWRVQEFFGEEEAAHVAFAFVGEDGKPAWERYQ